MSYVRLARALLHGDQYYGSALQSLQGPPERHRCMAPLVEKVRARNAGRPLKVLEIGSWAGASAVSWAMALKSLPESGRVVCVDPWLPYFDLNVESGFVYAAMNQVAQQGDALQLFLHNVKCAGVADIVDYWVGASRDILPQLEPASFDVIYVDGSHALDDVHCDLSNATRLVRDGGILCGDDLELQRDAIDPEEHLAALASGRDFVNTVSAGASYHPGVTEAVGRLFGPVFAWNGFWCVSRINGGWERLEFQPGELPAHIANALAESAADTTTSDSHDTPPPAVTPELVGETPGYNLVRLSERYVAVSKALGPIALGIERVGERTLAPMLFVDKSLEKVFAQAQQQEPSSRPDAAPELVDETANYNLVRLENKYVALSKGLGRVALGVERLGERTLDPLVLVGTTLEEVRALTAQRELVSPPSAALIDETPSYNLVRLGEHYLAVLKALGPVALGVERLGERNLEPVLLRGATLEQVRDRALTHEPPFLDVELIGQSEIYNLVRFDTRYLAIARALGEMAVGIERLGERELSPHILCASTPDELRIRVAEIEREALDVRPELVGETSTYNLVRIGSRFVAAAKSFGPMSLGTERVGDREIEPGILVGSSLDEIRSRAEAHEPATQPQTELIDQTRSYNLIRFGSQYVAVARSIEADVLGREKLGERDLPPHVLCSATLEGLRRRIAGDDPHRDDAEPRP